MKKQYIYEEFQRIAAEIVGCNRKKQKYYVMQMCEQLGKVDHKQSFVMWFTKKRCLAYQYDVQPDVVQSYGNDGTYYLFLKNAQCAEKVDIL